MASFSLSPNAVLRLRAAGMAARDARARQTLEVRAQWLARDKTTAVGRSFALTVPRDVAMEAFLPEGAIGHSPVTPALAFDDEPPAGAQHLRIGDGAQALIVSRATLRTARAPPFEDDERFGPGGVPFVFPVFAERYTNAVAFFAAVSALREWIVQIPPFTEQPVKDRFALHGYYWTTDPVAGQCNTRDIVYDCNHPPADAVTFNGNNDIARSLFGSLMLQRKYGLVLINSQVRGGAGGIAGHGYPAWSSTAQCPRESWQGVALHEIGHALGLADEYEDGGRSDERSLGEPNCATDEDPSAASWRTRFTRQPPSAASVFDKDQQARFGRPGGQPVPDADFVGLFQGGRYREDYYRPSFNCLMRYTNCAQFCPVCREHIRNQI